MAHAALGFLIRAGIQILGAYDSASQTSGGRLVHTLKDAIAWDYQHSVTHLRGWSVV